LEVMPNARYFILGDGIYRGELGALVDSLNLTSHVLFLGFQKNITPYLIVSDIALLLSKGEASPISLLEFAAAGLPVITSLYQPFPELVQPNWGQMVSERDTEQLSQAIIKLLLDSDLRITRGARGRAWVIENHVWSQVARQYQTLVGKK